MHSFIYSFIQQFMWRVHLSLLYATHSENTIVGKINSVLASEGL